MPCRSSNRPIASAPAPPSWPEHWASPFRISHNVHLAPRLTTVAHSVPSRSSSSLPIWFPFSWAYCVNLRPSHLERPRTVPIHKLPSREPSRLDTLVEGSSPPC